MKVRTCKKRKKGVNNEKIVGVEFKDSKIIFKIEDKFLFNKKEYDESIDISAICKIEKIYESGGNNEFTCIIFYQNVTEIDGTNLDTLDDEIINNEAMQEIIKEKSILYEVSAFKCVFEISELFDKVIAHLDMNNIEVVETII